MIGIQSALEKEMELIRERMADATTERHAGLDYVVGKIVGAEVVCVAGGVGKVHAAACAQSLIDLFHVESIVFCGVAGCLNLNLKVGDVVISQDLFQYDYIGDTKTAILGKISARFNESRVSADENLVRLAQTACTEVLDERSCVVGTVVTGDKPVLTRTARTRLRRKYGAECIDMEGAAVGAVCNRNSVPFVVLRAVSDSAGLLTPLEFIRNLSVTSERVQQVVLQLIAQTNR
jgi:adenosylhomocysteine nucleosidase